MTKKHEKGWEKPTLSEVATLKDDEILIEKKLPNVTKLDLTSLDQRQSMRALIDSHNGLIDKIESFRNVVWFKDHSDEFFEKLDLALESLERIENLLGMSCIYTVRPEPKKMTPEEKLKARTALITQEKVQAIKATIAEYPEFKDNLKFLQMQSGVHAQTIKKYRRQGLV